MRGVKREPKKYHTFFLLFSRIQKAKLRLRLNTKQHWTTYEYSFGS